MSAARRRLPGLHAFEWTALTVLLAALAFLAAAGLWPSARSALQTLRAMLTVGPLALFLGLLLQGLWRLLSRGSPGGYLARVATPTWLVAWLRLWAAVMAVSYAYFWLKLSVPLLREAKLDAGLWGLDRLLHGGVSPTGLALAWLPPSAFVTALDVWYALWLFSLVAGLGFFAAAPEPAARRGFALSCLLLWAFGAVGYLALPATGPVFAFPGLFPGHAEAMPLAAASQARLWANHQALLAWAAGRPDAAFQHTLGVAALPSLHVGFHVLFTLWARREAPAAWPLCAALAALTFVGSVRSGWHYALDGYAGAALAWVAYRLGRRLETPATPRKG